MIDYKQIATVLFLEEYSRSKDTKLQSVLDSLGNKYAKHLDTHTFAYTDHIYLDKILAMKDAPIGTGSAYMKELCAIADDYGRIVLLETAPKGYGNKYNTRDTQFKITSSGSRLAKFYSRFGFVSNYSSRDYRADLRGNMHRYPKNKKI